MAEDVEGLNNALVVCGVVRLFGQERGGDLTVEAEMYLKGRLVRVGDFGWFGSGAWEGGELRYVVFRSYR